MYNNCTYTTCQSFFLDRCWTPPFPKLARDLRTTRLAGAWPHDPYTASTGDAEFSRADRTVDQHSAAAFDTGARERDRVCHRRLDGVADADFALLQLAQLAAPMNTANRAGGGTR